MPILVYGCRLILYHIETTSGMERLTLTFTFCIYNSRLDDACFTADQVALYSYAYYILYFANYLGS